MGQSLETTTAERIRDVSARLFAERGFAATTVRMIASAADLTAGAIYNHYESKEAILNAIVFENHRELLNALTAATPPPDATAEAALDKLVYEFALHATRKAVATRASQREYSHLAVANRRRVLKLRRRALDIFEEVIEAGVASGEFAPASASPASARVAATSLVNMLVGIADSYDPSGPVTPEEVAAIHRELARRMTRGKPRRVRGAASDGALSPANRHSPRLASAVSSLRTSQSSG
jgi:AcrR family transcriptional regulator